MTKHKNNRRALILSLLSLLLCVSMLVGTTFAWFTDTDTTAVSNIVTGTLDIEIIDEEGNEKTDELKFLNANNSADILWEPGVTFQTEKFAIENKGNLNLKFKVEVSNTKVSDHKLNEVIKFSLVDATTGETVTLTDTVVAPLSKTGYYCVQGTMDANAGNEYQGLTMSGVYITVNATQAAVEYDSFNNTYDETAAYDESYNGYASVTAKNDDELKAALNSIAKGTPTVVTLSGDTATYTFPTWTAYSGSLNGKTIVFKANGDKTMDATFFNVNGTQNLVGANLTFDGVNVDFPANSWMSNGYTGMNLAGGKLTFKNATITGAQYLYVPTAEFINCVFETTTDSYSVATYGANTVTFTGCTFHTAGKAVLLYHDGDVTTNVTLTNCIFNSDASAADDKAAVETGDSGSKGSNFTLNFTNCEANGFVANNSTSNLWGNKVNSNMPSDRLSVTIDGVKVY